MTSDPSSSQSFAQAEVATNLVTETGIRNRTAAIPFQVIAIVNGEEVEEEFECLARDREHQMRSLGINPDNDPWAVRSKFDGRWNEPVGTSPELKQKLGKRH